MQATHANDMGAHAIAVIAPTMLKPKSAGTTLFSFPLASASLLASLHRPVEMYFIVKMDTSKLIY